MEEAGKYYFNINDIITGKEQIDPDTVYITFTNYDALKIN
jgi:hypothetical protein